MKKGNSHTLLPTSYTPVFKNQLEPLETKRTRQEGNVMMGPLQQILDDVAAFLENGLAVLAHAYWSEHASCTKYMSLMATPVRCLLSEHPANASKPGGISAPPPSNAIRAPTGQVLLTRMTSAKPADAA